jgi:hypothetical protein
MSNPRRLSILAVAAVPLLGLASLALVTASPSAAQQKSINTKPPLQYHGPIPQKPKPPQCYNPGGHAATVAWMGDHPDRPLHKGCPPSVGKAIGDKCYTCDGAGILDITTKWCHGHCKAGFKWNSAKKQCCG